MATATTYLTKRRTRDKDNETAAATAKRPRFNATLKRKFWSLATHGTLTAMHRLLTSNLKRADELFGSTPDPRFRRALLSFLLQRTLKLTPEMTALKELIAYAVIRNWIENAFTELPERLWRLPAAFPQYKVFLEAHANTTTSATPNLSF